MEAKPSGLALYSCKAHSAKIETVQRTWWPDLKQAGIPGLIINGGSERVEVGQGITYLACRDDYLGLPGKTVALAKYVLNETEWEFLIKCDDDVFLRPSVLLDVINQVSKKGNLDLMGFAMFTRPMMKQLLTYGLVSERELGNILRLYKGPYFPWVQGSLYVLSRRSLEIIASIKDPEQYGCEDTMVSLFLAKAGIKPIDISKYLCYARKGKGNQKRHLKSVNSSEIRKYAAILNCTVEEIALLHQTCSGHAGQTDANLLAR